MTRARAKKEPFFAVSLGNMRAGARGIVRELHEMVQRSGYGDIIWMGSGWRTGSVEHNSGTAIDVMLTSKTMIRPTQAEREAGLHLINWLIKHHLALGVEGILFSRDGKDRTEVWGYSTPGRGWRNLSNRGSISGNHIDHVHIKFKSTASWPTKLNGSTFGPGAKPIQLPGPPSTGVSNPKSIQVMAQEVIDGKHGNGHTNRQISLGINAATYALVRAEVNRRLSVGAATTPRPVLAPQFPVGIGPNKRVPSAVILQRQLKKAGFMPKTVKENANYGPATQKAVAAFHNAHTQYRSANNRNDVRIGPKGWKFLFERW